MEAKVGLAYKINRQIIDKPIKINKIYLDMQLVLGFRYLHNAVPAVLDHGEGEQHDAAPHLAGQELHLGLVVRSQLPLAAQQSGGGKLEIDTFLVDALLIARCISAGAIKPLWKQ